MPKNHYICADKILDNMTAELIELNAKQNQNPMQTVVNNAKKAQLEKYINLITDIKNEYNRQMDKGAKYIGTTAINVQSKLYQLQNQSC
jgi:LPS O-antigen subunit length determinant protein (WzzB/FepE family)